MRAVFRNRLLNTGILLAISCSFLFYAFSTGSSGNTTKNGSGCSCHSATSSAKVTVTTTGATAVGVNKSEVYTVTITGGLLACGGVDIAAAKGTLTPLDTTLTTSNGELVNAYSVLPSSSKITFTFTYTAPATATTDTIFVTGLSGDKSTSTSGDYWANAVNKVISVSPATDVNNNDKVLSFGLRQNYPNPFNPSTLISYSLNKNESVSLNIYDITGKQVASLINGLQTAGEHSVSFNASNLSSGVYLYKIATPSFSQVKKMILTK